MLLGKSPFLRHSTNDKGREDGRYPVEGLCSVLGWRGAALLRGMSTAEEASHAPSGGNQWRCFRALGWCITRASMVCYPRPLHRPRRMGRTTSIAAEESRRQQSSDHAQDTDGLDSAGAVSRRVDKRPAIRPLAVPPAAPTSSSPTRRDGIVDQFPSQRPACAAGRLDCYILCYPCVSSSPR
jgi:hypothetical protein